MFRVQKLRLTFTSDRVSLRITENPEDCHGNESSQQLACRYWTTASLRGTELPTFWNKRCASFPRAIKQALPSRLFFSFRDASQPYLTPLLTYTLLCRTKHEHWMPSTIRFKAAKWSLRFFSAACDCGEDENTLPQALASLYAKQGTPEFSTTLVERLLSGRYIFDELNGQGDQESTWMLTIRKRYVRRPLLQRSR